MIILLPVIGTNFLYIWKSEPKDIKFPKFFLAKSIFKIRILRDIMKFHRHKHVGYSWGRTSYHKVGQPQVANCLPKSCPNFMKIYVLLCSRSYEVYSNNHHVTNF